MIAYNGGREADDLSQTSAWYRLVKPNQDNPAVEGKLGSAKTQKSGKRSQEVIENKGSHIFLECETNRKRAAYERRMSAFGPQKGLCAQVQVLAGANRQVVKLIRRGNSGKACAKYKNSGNEAREYLKTKDMTF